MTEYRLTPAAEMDLEDIWRYTAQTWSVQQANDYTDTLATIFDELASWPSRARACDEIRKGYRRISIEHHTVYLTVELYGVAIVRILHKAMDATRHL
ncbi:type II toxin-antitoxin system RelE/ParE family toxin [Pseudomonas syringae pv. dysoxyli]|uniref:type II toxin-antitoxin system RelE/ParE family toxin n=1 Tax=Pseudomonas syringae TaxID=317 RepID=UPI001372F566|nr:type II toxin-antitoxin system RelE/ParE family toxin [Pseudomonas syringae]NAO28877.1 type II toxin-antitoxin system RelE/ParE family toxin [Pseudomonas syringae pv. dysoxyli]